MKSLQFKKSGRKEVGRGKRDEARDYVPEGGWETQSGILRYEHPSYKRKECESSRKVVEAKETQTKTIK